MSEEQYNELLKAYTKEVLANMIKADIRQRFPEPYASMYCQQFDDFKNVFEMIFSEHLLLQNTSASVDSSLGCKDEISSGEVELFS